MDKSDLLNRYNEQLAELRKVVKNWNLIPGSPIDEFDALCNKVISHLYIGTDEEQIRGVIESELLVRYGLRSNEFDSERLAAAVMSWWNNTSC
jgi:hypothetical protein